MEVYQPPIAVVYNDCHGNVGNIEFGHDGMKVRYCEDLYPSVIAEELQLQDLLHCH
jgi:hypothetical protein